MVTGECRQDQNLLEGGLERTDDERFKLSEKYILFAASTNETHSTPSLGRTKHYNFL